MELRPLIIHELSRQRQELGQLNGSALVAVRGEVARGRGDGFANEERATDTCTQELLTAARRRVSARPGPYRRGDF